MSDHTKALIMVVSRIEAVEVVVECQRLKERAKFLYTIVDSPMEIQHSFSRFEYFFGLLGERGYPAKDVVLDATGGTTTMRLGTALAAISKVVRMVHQRVHMDLVDGEWRRDDSKPIKIVPMQNPLESTGLLRERQDVELFDRRNYGAAALIFHDVALKVEGVERGNYYTGLARLSEGYAAWDVADYSRALEKLPGARRELSVGFSDQNFVAKASGLISTISSNLEFLGKVRGKLSVENVVDMLENARRCIADQGRYDDGVARLYRCIEMFHQWHLQSVHGIRATGTDWEGVDEAEKAEFLRRTGFAGLPKHLDRGGARALDGVLSGADEEEGNLFRDLLRQRNSSILAHGLEPIGEASARRFLDHTEQMVGNARVRSMAAHSYLGRD